jgi:molecular chaperone IbpA
MMSIEYPKNYFIGFDSFFDRFFRELNSVNHAAAQGRIDKYPIYDIIRTSDTTFEIHLAVAGFKRSEISVEVSNLDLIIRGDNSMEDKRPNFIYKQISSRTFERVFKLYENVVVKGASMEDGILAIYLEVVIPEEKRPRKIEIGDLSQFSKINHDSAKAIESDNSNKPDTNDRPAFKPLRDYAEAMARQSKRTRA